MVSALDQRPRGRGFESVGCLLSCSNRGPVALCTLDLGLLNPPSSPGWQISTGYNWEGIRQVRATLLGARHVPERPCGGCVYLWRYIKCSTFTFDLSGSRDVISHVTILITMGHFLLVVHWTQVSISSRFRDIWP